MTVFIEKRMHDRFDHITSKVKYKRESDKVYAPALLINYSEGGMFLKINERMNIGQSITIKMEETRKNTTTPNKYEFYHGRIKRVNYVHINTHEVIYRYGIEYDEPVSFFEGI